MTSDSWKYSNCSPSCMECFLKNAQQYVTQHFYSYCFNCSMKSQDTKTFWKQPLCALSVSSMIGYMRAILNQWVSHRKHFPRFRRFSLCSRRGMRKDRERTINEMKCTWEANIESACIAGGISVCTVALSRFRDGLHKASPERTDREVFLLAVEFFRSSGMIVLPLLSKLAKFAAAVVPKLCLSRFSFRINSLSNFTICIN